MWTVFSRLPTRFTAYIFSLPPGAQSVIFVSLIPLLCFFQERARGTCAITEPLDLLFNQSTSRPPLDHLSLSLTTSRFWQILRPIRSGRVSFVVHRRKVWSLRWVYRLMAHGYSRVPNTCSPNPPFQWLLQLPRLTLMAWDVLPIIAPFLYSYIPVVSCSCDSYNHSPPICLAHPSLVLLFRNNYIAYFARINYNDASRFPLFNRI